MTAQTADGPLSAEVLPGVHRIDAVFGDRFASLYLFVGSQRSVLFDTGTAGSIPGHVVPYAEQAGLRLDAIEQVVVSHFDVDHFGGVGDVAQWLPRGRVVAHERDAGPMEDFDEFLRERGSEFAARYGLKVDPSEVEWMRGVVTVGRVDERVHEDYDIDLGDRVIRVLHTPGHTWGHLSIHDPGNSFLAISDAILGDSVPTADGLPGFPPTYRHERPYLETIELARALNPEHLATAHAGILVGGDVGAYLDRSRDFVRALRSQVTEALMRLDREVLLSELLTELNPLVGDWPKEGAEGALAFPVVGHLEQFALEGDVRITDAVDGAMLSSVRRPRRR